MRINDWTALADPHQHRSVRLHLGVDVENELHRREEAETAHHQRDRVRSKGRIEEKEARLQNPGHVRAEVIVDAEREIEERN